MLQSVRANGQAHVQGQRNKQGSKARRKVAKHQLSDHKQMSNQPTKQMYNQQTHTQGGNTTHAQTTNANT